MCCFTGPVASVSATQIFARALPDGRELLAYSMTVGFAADVAMVLPIPTPIGVREDAVAFVDMSSCAGFFDDLDALYPKPQAGFGPMLALAPAPIAHARLKVHAVGDFEASFVPTVADFARLDPRFRMPESAWRALPEYADWGFAVFKLKRAGDVQKVHPMAFTFPRRDRDALFFPTVHVHDGVVHDTAHFDHTLYAQVDPSWEPAMTAFRAPTATSALAPAARAFVDERAPIYRELWKGDLPNDDVWMRGERLRGRVFVGESFRVRVNTAWDALSGGGRGRPRTGAGLDPQVWREVQTPEAERRRARDVAGALVAETIASRGVAWGVIPIRYDLPEVHPGAYVAGVFGAPPTPEGCTMTLFDYARSVMGIGVTIAFRAVPSPEVVAEVKAMLRAAIARVDG